MRAELTGIYNGFKDGTFTSPNGNEIGFRTVTLLEKDSNYTLDCGVARDVDLSALNRFDEVTFFVNLFNGKRPKIVGFEVGSVIAK